MTDFTTSTAIDAKVAARAMLSHPFYQAWTEGRLPLATLRDYARQYFHHVEAFPRAVSAVHSACPDRDGRRMLAENLAEEEGLEAGKQDHASLWLMFACGLGEDADAVRGQALYAETEASIARRANEAEGRKLYREPGSMIKGRPSKHDRRALSKASE